MDTNIFWIWELLGRLHPLVVHFPIGLIVVAGFLELLTMGGKRTGLRDGIGAMLLIGAITAVIAAAVGLFLVNTGGYAGQTVSFHQWSGIATALIALCTAWLYRRARQHDSAEAWSTYRVTLCMSLIAITIAGHQGASITHGSGYLTEVLPWNRPDPLQAGNAEQVLAGFKAISTQADVPSSELDRLNLEVRAIFAHSCYRCHSTEKHEGGLILDNQEDVFAGGETGPIFIPGSASESEIIRRLTLPREHEEAMPQKGKPLTRAQIELIELWINLGSHWADRELKIFPEAELALKEPSLPSSDVYSHPVDLLIDDYFDKKNLSWPALVDDRTFIRRVYLDVVGLLPTPDQVQAFLEDSNLQKRDQLVNELLDQSPAYAQHWLTFWNDLLRNDYSGTGYITGGRKQISQWLYAALKENWSYDQIARGLINPTPESEGFIRGIQWRGDVNNSQRIEMQAAQNISQSLMGVNLKCASCHNSFVSNLTLDEAYGFATIFADSSLEIQRCDTPTGRFSKPSFLYPQLGTIDGGTIEERLVQLADVIVQPANGRLYRTFVNRYWDKLLGRGIVMPVDEMDQTPWSQELLDWLAADFIEHDTDIKHLMRRIMTSRAYQLESTSTTDVNELMAASFAFEGPVRRRMTAEQFADAMSQILGPVYHSVTFDPYGQPLKAEWVWHRERTVDRDVLPAPGKRFFRHTFRLDSTASLEIAEALIAVDHSFSLFINETLVASGSDWRVVHRLDLLPHLQQGDNIIAVEGINDGDLPNPAGILFSLNLIDNDGSSQMIQSSQQWKSTMDQPESDWIRLSYDDSEWASVRRYGRFDRSHWQRLLDFHHDADHPRLEMARASLVKLDPFLKALGRPTRENVTTRRDDQATLLQALELTNGEFFYTALQEGSIRWLENEDLTVDGLIHDLYLTALGRPPERNELRTAQELLGQNPSEESVQDLLWAVFMLPEFQLIL